MSGRLILLVISLVLTACQAVPIGNGASKTEKPRPVKPLPWVGKASIEADKNAASKGFKVADTTAPAKKTTAKAGTKASAQPNNTEIAAKLAEAEDKAASALSMQQSAQTQDDWNLVFDRWKLAIQMAKALPGKNAQVQQKIAEFQAGLQKATQAAKVSLDPSLAPVDAAGANAKGLIGVPGGDADKAAKPDAKAAPGEPQAAPTAAPNKPGASKPNAAAGQPDASATPKQQ